MNDRRSILIYNRDFTVPQKSCLACRESTCSTMPVILTMLTFHPTFMLPVTSTFPSLPIFPNESNRYSAAIDMWSLGCIVVELFLGLPLFPGSSEYNQVSRITEMLGLPPTWMLECGKQSNEFFEKTHDEFGRRTYRLKSMEQYAREHSTKEQPSKKYFSATTLPEIIRQYPMPRKNMKQHEIDRGRQHHSDGSILGC
jgi:serine/threonine protein kinase